MEAWRMTSYRPLVSLGIPVYNGAWCLPQALDALIAQTYGHLEIIIADNASTDRTEEICRAYAARDLRIKYYRNATNIGLIANFRRVFELSSGQYFMWAAADDLKPPTAIERCVGALLHNDHAVMAHGIVLVQTVGTDELVEYPNNLCLSEANAAARVRVFTRGLQHNAMLYGLYRRQALQQGVLGQCLGQDYLLCLQMCLLGPLAYVQTPIVIYRTRKTIASRSPMYIEVPISSRALLYVGKVNRRKCWTVLIMGCYYLATRRHVKWSERSGAIAAHVVAFSQLHRSRLAKEVVFQLFAPVLWISIVLWHLAHRCSLTLRLARKVRALLLHS
jgi:glycosyltransferase involved in cell wall biosynthesis